MKTDSMKMTSLLLSLAVLVFASTNAQGAFLGTQRRFVTPLDLVSLLQMQFPGGSLSYVGQDCSMVTDENRGVLGDANPTTGQSTSIEPTPAFDQWFRTCLNLYIEADTQSLRSIGTPEEMRATLKRYAGPKASDALLQQLKMGPGSELAEMYGLLIRTKWQELEPSMQQEIIRFRLRKLLGTDPVILDKGVVTNVDELRERLFTQMLKPGPELSLLDALKRLTALIALREEFLVY